MLVSYLNSMGQQVSESKISINDRSRPDSSEKEDRGVIWMSAR